MTRDSMNEKLRIESGEVYSADNLVSFLYEIMRDHIPPGKVEEVMRNSISNKVMSFSNGWLAKYATYVATQLTGSKNG